jgi:hypothetical protein
MKRAVFVLGMLLLAACVLAQEATQQPEQMIPGSAYNYMGMPAAHARALRTWKGGWYGGRWYGPSWNGFAFGGPGFWGGSPFGWGWNGAPWRFG